MEKIINIRPRSLHNVIFWICGLLLPAALFIVSFLILFLENNIGGFVLSILFAIVLSFLMVKAMLFKISFQGIAIKSSKKNNQEKLDIRCGQIFSCEFSSEGLLQYYFCFKCADGKIRKLFVMPYSVIQLRQVLVMIKERGGLQEQDIDELTVKLQVAWYGKKKI